MLEERFSYIRRNYDSPRGIGTPKFGDGKQWCHCFLEYMEPRAKMVVLDYGCGDGRLGNFMSAVFQDWHYYGLEHPQSALQQFAEQSFVFKDPRCTYGVIGSEIEKEALNQADFVVLGSVFTHLAKEDFEEIMNKFDPVLDRAGEVLFSIFLADEYMSPEEGGIYGVKNCRGIVYYTEDYLEDWAKKNNLKLEYCTEFLAQGQHLHKIFKVTRLK